MDKFWDVKISHSDKQWNKANERFLTSIQEREHLSRDLIDYNMVLNTLMSFFHLIKEEDKKLTAASYSKPAPALPQMFYLNILALMTVADTKELVTGAINPKDRSLSPHQSYLFFILLTLHHCSG